MQQRLVSEPDCDQDTLMHLAIDVRPAHRSSRWAWRLVDGRDRSEFESGFEYDSPSEARRAALGRLAELTSALQGAATMARRPASVSRSVTPLYRKSA